MHEQQVEDLLAQAERVRGLALGHPRDHRRGACAEHVEAGARDRVPLELDPLELLAPAELARDLGDLVPVEPQPLQLLPAADRLVELADAVVARVQRLQVSQVADLVRERDNLVLVDAQRGIDKNTKKILNVNNLC